ncbi:hypothetical protein [Hyphomicrobium sp. MC8b]|uniref:hypothetical protein n=1 Tax=Hyphomicrobium sp. MC8b TaxID=300273 RepID=UPI00391ABD1A
MSMLGWIHRRERKPDTEVTPSPAPKPVINKRPKIDPEVAREWARKNSPWRYDDGPSRRPVGGK